MSVPLHQGHRTPKPEPVRLGASRLQTYETCERQYYFQYVEKIKTTYTDANLAFGHAMHTATEAWLRGLYASNPIDIAERFSKAWHDQLETQEIQFSTEWTDTKMRDAGLMLAERFPPFWRTTGFVVLQDSLGPIMERELHVPLDEFILVNKTDLVVGTEDGQVISFDTKTPRQLSPEGFVHLAEQLTISQIALEHHGAALGIERVDGLGYIEGVKKPVPKTSRGEGPTWHVSEISPRRSDADVREYLQKCAWRARQIRAGQFPKRPGYAHNSPCNGMCRYRRYCQNGDKTDLVFPSQPQSKLALP